MAENHIWSRKIKIDCERSYLMTLLIVSTTRVRIIHFANFIIQLIDTNMRGTQELLEHVVTNRKHIFTSMRFATLARTSKNVREARLDMYLLIFRIIDGIDGSNCKDLSAYSPLMCFRAIWLGNSLPSEIPAVWQSVIHWDLPWAFCVSRKKRYHNSKNWFAYFIRNEYNNHKGITTIMSAQQSRPSEYRILQGNLRRAPSLRGAHHPRHGRQSLAQKSSMGVGSDRIGVAGPPRKEMSTR